MTITPASPSQAAGPSWTVGNLRLHEPGSSHQLPAVPAAIRAQNSLNLHAAPRSSARTNTAQQHGGIRRSARLPHAVLLRARALAVLALKVVAHLNVQVTRVLVVGLACQLAADRLARADGDDVLEVEHRLLPVRRLALGGGGEEHRLVASAKSDVKVGHKRVDVVVAVSGQRKGHLEGGVLLAHGADVDGQHLLSGGRNLLGVHHIDQRLCHGQRLDAGEVKAVHVVPVVDLLRLVLAVLNAHDVQGGLVGQDDAVGGEPLVPGINYCVEHGLIEQEVAHPLADNDVNLVHWECDLLHLALNDGHSPLIPVVPHDLLRLVRDRAALDAVHVLRASL
mmetsp:Transcript_27342/g.69582  ORF Transcript_27342/g.69582 Transcript_27342/m.69582 type:complete len:337 (+) Transcript_27342:337-1347(+)